MNNWRQILSWQVAEPPAYLHYDEGRYILGNSSTFIIEEIFTNKQAAISYLHKYYNLSWDRAELIVRDAKELGSCEF